MQNFLIFPPKNSSKTKT